MGNPLRIGVLVLTTVVVLFTGFLLTRAGRPYGTALLTTHKLLDVVAIGLVGVVVYGALRSSGGSPLHWTLLALAVVLAVATLASGGVMSAMSASPAWAVNVHRIAPWPLLATVGALLYVVLFRTPPA